MITYRAILDAGGLVHAHVKESVEELALSLGFSDSEVSKLTKYIDSTSKRDDYSLSILTLEISEKGYVLTMVLKDNTTRTATYLK
jgi:hypothetical protein